MNQESIREYDIRGIAGKDINEEDVNILGKAIGTYLKRSGNNKLVVGRDCRLTSDEFSEKLITGLLSTGCDVVDIGICPTPVFYFSIRNLNLDGGVMVTASHNPPEYNGFKICSGTDSVFGSELKKIYEIACGKSFLNGFGLFSNTDIIPAYQSFMLKNISIKRALKVGVDAGNGTAGVIAVPILKNFGCEIFDLYCDMDGRFPNHEADPTVLKNMKDLISLVKKNKLDVGIGFDGDGDRIGVIDEQGNIIYGDKLMIIFAREILSRKPGSTFISEVKCSKVMYDDIKNKGGHAVMWKTGHSLIKQKIKEEKAELAAEMSGHVFFSDRYFGFDDAIYSCLRLLEILSNTDKKLSELLRDVPVTYSTPEIRLDCPDEIKFDIVKKITDFFKTQYEVIDIDGARVLFEDGWGLIRASNTQPSLVLRFEATTEKRLAEIRKIIENKLVEYYK